MKRLLCCVGVVMLTLLLAACGGLAGEPAIVATMPATTPPVLRPISLPRSAPDLALGAQVFAANCTRCHGVSGQGDGELVQSGQVPALMDFTAPQTAQNDAPLAWYEVVTNGRLDKLMPPWGDKLSDAERWAVTLYVYTLASTSEQLAAGQVVWATTCAECHGTAGEGTSKGAALPNLLEISNAEALAALQNGIPDKMPSQADKLTPEQMAAALAYARTLWPTNPPVEVAQSPTDSAVVAPNATQEVGAPLPTVAAPSATQEAGAPAIMGTVGGIVSSGTAGGLVPADLALSLHVIASDQSAQTFEGKVGADGSYRFADVPFAAGSQYVVSTSYEGAVFSSEVVTGDPAAPQLDLPLSLYEVTGDPAAISINGLLMMLQTDDQPGRLSVVQIVSFTNASDRVYLQAASGAPTSVSVRLPAGAVYQDFSGGGYVISADGSEISDTQAVLPGDAHVMHLAYSVPYGGAASLTQPLDYPLNGSLEILAESGGMVVSGSDISTLGTRQMGDLSFTSFGGTFSRAAGDLIQFQVSAPAAAQTTASAPFGGVSTIAYVLIGAGLLAIGAAFGFFMRERTSAPARASAPGESAEVSLLVKQIAQLDVRYQERKIHVKEYNERRQALKAELAALMKAKAESDSPDA